MPAKLPDNIKSIVIQEWLQGIGRNEIAANNGIGAGSVTNIVNEWRSGVGFVLADELRELSVAMKKVGITAAQCALGFRAAMIMSKIGVDEDNIEYFISDIYNKCSNIGLSAENIAIYLQDLLEFSSSSIMPILPISKVGDYLREKTEQKIELENQIEGLKLQIQQIGYDKFTIEKLRDDALQQQKMIASDLKWYSDLRSELGSKYGIPIEDISKFAKIVHGIREYGYDVGKVVNEFSNLEALRIQNKDLQQSVQKLEARFTYLIQQCSKAEATLNIHTQTISKYTQLESMEFGLKELTLLWNIVNEIADANNIPIQEVKLKFFTDIEEQYDKKLGFENKLEKLKVEVNKLNQELTRSRIELSGLQLVGPALSKLIQSGLKEQDIINMASIFEKYFFVGIDRQQSSLSSLISELDKYGGFRSAIEKLSKEKDKLNNEIASLRKEKQDLETDTQKISSTLAHLNHDIFFLQGYINALKNEIIGLSLTAAIITYFLKLPIDDFQKSGFYYYVNRNNIQNSDLLPLIRADNGEKNILLQQLRKGVIKAIEILLGRIRSDNNEANNSKLIEILTNTTNVLVSLGNNNNNQ
jgi:predicted  nucleic acid-binding Zn-ribbon protein